MLSTSIAFLTLALAEPGAAPTQTADPSQHRWRLHAEITPVRVFSRTAGASTQRSLSLTLPGSAAIGFGRALGRYVMAGARFGGDFSRYSSSTSIGGEPWRYRVVSGGGWLMPYVELRPLPDRRVQPFGLLEGGVTLYGTRRHALAGPAQGPRRSFHANPALGGRVGLHAFVLPRLSIDADLGLQRQWIYEWRASPAVSPDDVTTQPVYLRLNGTVGLSGWW